MAKVIYKFSPKGSLKHNSFLIEPSVPIGTNWIGDINHLKKIVNNWNEGVEWITTDQKLEGYLHTLEPFSVLQFVAIPYSECSTDDPRLGKIFEFSIIVRCHDYQEEVDTDLRLLAELSNLSIYRSEWILIC